MKSSDVNNSAGLREIAPANTSIEWLYPFECLARSMICLTRGLRKSKFSRQSQDLTTRMLKPDSVTDRHERGFDTFPGTQRHSHHFAGRPPIPTTHPAILPAR